MLNHLVILTLFLFIGVSSEAVNSTGVNWALLVAGSNEFYNYRHQVYFKKSKYSKFKI